MMPGMNFPEIPARLPVSGELTNILRAATMAADMEVLNGPPRVSSVRNPDGSAQGETAAERTRRIVETAIMYAVENGLLAVSPDAAARLDDYLPAQRAPA